MVCSVFVGKAKPERPENLSSIHLFINLSWYGLQRQRAKQSCPDVALPSHVLLLILGDSKTFLGQMWHKTDVIPPVHYGSALWSPPSWMSLEQPPGKACLLNTWTTSVGSNDSARDVWTHPFPTGESPTPEESNFSCFWSLPRSHDHRVRVETRAWHLCSHLSGFENNF